MPRLKKEACNWRCSGQVGFSVGLWEMPGQLGDSSGGRLRRIEESVTCPAKGSNLSCKQWGARRLFNLERIVIVLATKAHHYLHYLLSWKLFVQLLL